MQTSDGSIASGAEVIYVENDSDWGVNAGPKRTTAVQNDASDSMSVDVDEAKLPPMANTTALVDLVDDSATAEESSVDMDAKIPARSGVDGPQDMDVEMGVANEPGGDDHDDEVMVLDSPGHKGDVADTVSSQSQKENEFNHLSLADMMKYEGVDAIRYDIV